MSHTVWENNRRIYTIKVDDAFDWLMATPGRRQPEALRQGFGPTLIEAMQGMQALDALKQWSVNGQQTYSTMTGKLPKPSAGEVAERLKAAVC